MMMLMTILKRLSVLFLPLLLAHDNNYNHHAHAFLQTQTTTTSRSSSSRANSPLHFFPSSTSTQVVTKEIVFDGPEWISLQECLSSTRKSDYGKMTVVVGTRQDTGDKVVGVLVAERNAAPTVALQDDLLVYETSVAKLPSNIKEQDAINTMVAALTGVHCTAPRVQGVGGDTDEEASMVSGKVVVLGSSDYACFAAEGLAALGTQVSLVSTNKVNIRNPNVDILPPAIGEEEIGFASYVGEFDALLDTADDERPSQRFFQYDDDEDDDTDNLSSRRGTTLRLLQDRHDCHRYISSMTQAQSIVNQEGVLFGPGKVKSHFQDIQKSLQQRPQSFQPIVPPPQFGKTVETLLEQGIVYRNNKDFLSANNNKIPLLLRSWSMKDFMEVSTWPRDSSGSGSRTVRYGLPVLEGNNLFGGGDDDDDEEEMISAPPATADGGFISRAAWDKDIEAENRARDELDRQNPYVTKIVGATGLYETIAKEERDCVMFLSATFCRTCKSLNPKFTALARRSMEESNDNLLFAKADATGEVGKDLGRLMKIDAVPAFVLFRKGRRFGPALSISTIPNKKLAAAIDLLVSGQEWDESVIREATKE